MVIFHAEFVDEHLVESSSTTHLLECTDFYSWVIHVNDETSETLVLGKINIGAANDFTDIGIVGSRGPHFLARDNPFVAITDRFGLQ